MVEVFEVGSAAQWRQSKDGSGLLPGYAFLTSDGPTRVATNYCGYENVHKKMLNTSKHALNDQMAREMVRSEVAISERIVS